MLVVYVNFYYNSSKRLSCFFFQQIQLKCSYERVGRQPPTPRKHKSTLIIEFQSKKSIIKTYLDINVLHM